MFCGVLVFFGDLVCLVGKKMQEKKIIESLSFRFMLFGTRKNEKLKIVLLFGFYCVGVSFFMRIKIRFLLFSFFKFLSNQTGDWYL